MTTKQEIVLGLTILSAFVFFAFIFHESGRALGHSEGLKEGRKAGFSEGRVYQATVLGNPKEN